MTTSAIPLPTTAAPLRWARFIQPAITLSARLPHSFITFLGRFSIAAVFWPSGQTNIKAPAVNLIAGDIRWPGVGVRSVHRSGPRLGFVYCHRFGRLPGRRRRHYPVAPCPAGPSLQFPEHSVIIWRTGLILRAGQRRGKGMSDSDLPAQRGQPAREELWDERFLTDLRRDMVRFAELQLRDQGAAEDAVQEALAAALSGQNRFAGQSALKTWVFAILKNKIIDHLRQRQRFVAVASLAQETDDETGFEVLFDRKGHWNPADRPNAWGDPETVFAQQQFWVVFEACLTRLPENTARVFMMREFLGLETPAICRELALTTSHCHVILHRARMGLRLCLEQRWFTPGDNRC